MRKGFLLSAVLLTYLFAESPEGDLCRNQNETPRWLQEKLTPPNCKRDREPPAPRHAPPPPSHRPDGPPPPPGGDRVAWVHFDGSFIYWWAKQEGNDYATTGNAITVPGTTDPNTNANAGAIVNGDVFAPCPQMNPGFKAGLGVTIEPRDWDVFAEYTRFFGKGDDSVSSLNLNSGIIPLYSYTPNNSIMTATTFFASSGGTGFVSQATSYWSLHFNSIDLELRKMMQLYPTLSLRPHFGLQGSWQKQKFTAHYTVRSFTNHNFLGSNRVISNQDFWGVGPRGGLDGVWRMWKHFALYTNSAVAVLWSEFKNRGISFDTNTAQGYANVQIGNTLNKLHTLCPVVELELGLQADWDIRDEYRFLMQAGWEEQFWFFQNARSTSIANTSLVLQGFSFRFQFEF